MKILLIRFSSIGDIVITSPVIRAVRNKYPTAEIDFLTKKQFAHLVEHSTYLNQIVTLNNNEGETISELKANQYDLVIDLHKNLRTKRIKRALKTRWISYSKINIQKWLFSNFKVNLLRDKHLVDRYFDSLTALDIRNDNQGLEYFFPRVFQMNLDAHALKERTYIALTVGGTYYTKQIPEDIILEVIKRLDAPLVLLGGGAADEEKAKQIVAKCNDGERVINLCSQLSMHESAYVIKHAKSLITGDTGMMHIASAFDTPIEAVWGNTHPLFGMYAYRPENKNINNHQVDLPCNPCSKLGSDNCPRGHFKCMMDQDVAQIVKNCSSIEPIQ